jgi:hypothetical protein
MTNEQAEIEKQLAQEVLDRNADLLESLSTIGIEYAQEGRADKFYVLVKAVNMVNAMTQARMKQTLGIEAAKGN